MHIHHLLMSQLGRGALLLPANALVNSTSAFVASASAGWAAALAHHKKNICNVKCKYAKNATCLINTKSLHSMSWRMHGLPVPRLCPLESENFMCEIHSLTEHAPSKITACQGTHASFQCQLPSFQLASFQLASFQLASFQLALAASQYMQCEIIICNTCSIISPSQSFMNPLPSRIV